MEKLYRIVLNIVKQVSDISPRTTVAFLSKIVRKDKKNDKPVKDTDTRLKNYCS